MKFYFDQWDQLAKQDNITFEEKRGAILKQLIERWVSNDNDLSRLNGLQFHINKYN
jgi:hypothetical protein